MAVQHWVVVVRVRANDAVYFAIEERFLEQAVFETRSFVNGHVVLTGNGPNAVFMAQHAQRLLRGLRANWQIVGVRKLVGGRALGYVPAKYARAHRSARKQRS